MWLGAIEGEGEPGRVGVWRGSLGGSTLDTCGHRQGNSRASTRDLCPTLASGATFARAANNLPMLAKNFEWILAEGPP